MGEREHIGSIDRIERVAVRRPTHFRRRWWDALVLAVLVAAFARGDAPITIHLAGDSTMAEKQDDDRPETGWGEMLQEFFDATVVRVENHARNGRSTRTFIEEGRWEALVDRLQKGDYVFIQFGHNDQSEAKEDRYTPPDQYRANLIRFVNDVRAREAMPVLITPVVRRRFDDRGRFYDTHGAYPDLVREVASAADVPLIDMHRRSENVLRTYGEHGTKPLFLHLARGEYPNYPDGLMDDTHFSPIGAEIMAALAVEGIREQGLDLAAHLRRQGTPKRFLQGDEFDAVVDASYDGGPGTRIDGVPVYTTIGGALDAVPDDNAEPFVIFIRQGRYHEKLSVDRPNVHLLGEDRQGTIITYDASAGTAGPDGEPLGTGGSFTLRITKPGFRAERLTVENAFDYPANAAKADDHPSKVESPQAVAVMTTAESDRAVFRDCTISGYQDTLFIDAGRHYFHACRITGHVDFIFGAGQAVFDDAEIVSRDREGKDPTGYVTAPSTPISYPYGFLFIDSRFIKESPDLPTGSVRLGRPWHPGADPRVDGSAVFVRCFMDDHIGADGYARISARNDARERIWFDLEPDSRFFEHRSYGPGALSGPRRPGLSAEAAAWYTPAHVLNGWDPGRRNRRLRPRTPRQGSRTK